MGAVSAIRALSWHTCSCRTVPSSSSEWEQLGKAAEQELIEQQALMKRSGSFPVGPLPKCTSGKLFSPAFLEAVETLYSYTMGCENMGPMLYALVRFVKPRHVLEIGSGFTSIFILQALYDNHAELGGEPSILHCVDNVSHGHTTADKVDSVACVLRLQSFLRKHVSDAWDFSDSGEVMCVDFLWLDFGVGRRLDEFLQKWWRCLVPGALVLVHSALTNGCTRAWTEKARRGDLEGLNCEMLDYEMMSFLEPHKHFQNAFNLLQKREGFREVGGVCPSSSIGADMLCTPSALLSHAFSNAVGQLYDVQTCFEIIGLTLYSLVRFVKPIQVVQVGFGYTSMFILQALHDNDVELRALHVTDPAGAPMAVFTPCGCPWTVGSIVHQRCTESKALLHCVVDASASQAESLVAGLGLREFLRRHAADAWEFGKNPPSDAEPTDLLWLPADDGEKLEVLLENWWPSLAPGALVVVQSSVTDPARWQWLENSRNQIAGFKYRSITLLEPHVKNSLTVLQKRENFQEPVYTWDP